MASFSIMDEDRLLAQRYKDLEEEKIALERAIQELEAKENAKMKKHDQQCSENRTKEKDMVELLNAYRLSGISVTEVDESSVTLIFDTCYKDQYFESYLIKVNTTEGRIVSHTLPFFVPCAALAQQHLPNDLNLFARAINNHVCSYVKRRQQCLETRKKFDDRFSKPMEHSSAYDFVRMDLTFNCIFITVIMNYQLDSDLPEKIVAFVHNADSTLKIWCEETFGKENLEIATEHLVRRLTSF